LNTVLAKNNSAWKAAAGADDSSFMCLFMFTFLRRFLLGWFGVLLIITGRPAELTLPPRPSDAPTGSRFVERIETLSLADREKEIIAEVLKGNVPNFWRRLAEVPVAFTNETGLVKGTLYVTPEYLAVGSTEDYFLAPISPGTAQTVADALDCILPTRRMVDAIYAAAPIKLTPQPIPPSAAMTTVPVFLDHHKMVQRQRASLLDKHPLGTLIAGHKKDVVLTVRLTNAPGKVAIYGWHQPNGKPIQPLYLGHTSSWVDYSHGARFVYRKMQMDGGETDVAQVLNDPKLAPLLSDEGPLSQLRYR
jgi:hypothetical protein